MAFSSGVFSRIYNFATLVAGGTKVDATRMDSELDGVATALSACVLKDGTQTMTANIPMNSKKFTGLAAGTASGDSLRYEQAGMHLLTSGTVSDAATLDIALTSYTAFRGFKFVLGGFRPAIDSNNIYIRFSSDGGSNFDETGYNFAALSVIDSSSTPTGNVSGSASQILVSAGNNIGNGTTEGWNGEITLLNPSSSAFWSRVQFTGYHITSDSTPAGHFMTGGGSREAAQNTDAIRFYFGSGNIAEGTYAVYGLL